VTGQNSIVNKVHSDNIAAVNSNPKLQSSTTRDRLGSRIGSIASRVNKVIAPHWKTDQEIAEAAGLDLRQARARLYHGAVSGLYERSRVIRYRLRRSGTPSPRK